MNLSSFRIFNLTVTISKWIEQKNGVLIICNMHRKEILKKEAKGTEKER